MSIRLWSDGHSFPAELQGGIDKGALLVELLSPKTTLVPAAEFRSEEAAEYLRLAGLPCRESESAVWSNESADIVAVMAIDRSVRELLPANVEFTSPLLTAPKPAAQSLWAARYEELIYIKVWEDEVRLAEVLTLHSEEDLLYYIEQLGRWLKLKNYTLKVEGDEPRSLLKRLKNYFQ